LFRSVAQLARAPVSKTGGCGFESHLSCQSLTVVGKKMAKTNPIEFIKQVRQEVGKVTWPTRKETTVTSIMVFIISLIAAVFFFAADGLIANVIRMILG
jgi:preprotein translocase subunit SecE